MRRRVWVAWGRAIRVPCPDRATVRVPAGEFGGKPRAAKGGVKANESLICVVSQDAEWRRGFRLKCGR